MMQDRKSPNSGYQVPGTWHPSPFPHLLQGGVTSNEVEERIDPG
jgi:hypothetical protein